MKRKVTIIADSERASSLVEEILDVIKGSRFLSQTVIAVRWTDGEPFEIRNPEAFRPYAS